MTEVAVIEQQRVVVGFRRGGCARRGREFRPELVVAEVTPDDPVVHLDDPLAGRQERRADEAQEEEARLGEVACPGGILREPAPGRDARHLVRDEQPLAAGVPERKVDVVVLPTHFQRKERFRTPPHELGELPPRLPRVRLAQPREKVAVERAPSTRATG